MGDTIHATLPCEPNSFVGRETDLGRLRDLLPGTGLLTLCGAGGIGKTRLALRLLASVADDFPDGVRFVELADLGEPGLVVARVAAATGVSEEPGRPLRETLADALAGRRLLLALDNCEHLADACAQLCRHLMARAPGLRLIATSRAPLHVAGETVWQVPPLPAVPDALRLFADRAAAAMPGFTVTPGGADAIAALCQALDGIPLAIELAAARVRVLSVDQIRDRLADRFELLTDGDRTAPHRQRTLLAAIEWSHELLTPPEQALLRRLSVFAGWSLEMAEQVCADHLMPAASVLDLLTALVDKSLVVREPEVLGQARYRMLDTIRDYAAARLAGSGEQARFRRRLRDYTLRVVEHNHAVGMALVPAPWRDRVDVFRRFDVDGANLAQVLRQCRADRDAHTGLRVCTAVRPCWLVRGTYAEGIDWLDSFLGMPAEVPAGVRGAALTGRAQLMLSRDPAAAEPSAARGLRLSRAAGDQFWIAAALNVLSEIALHTGRAAEAVTLSGQALAVARLAGDGWNEGYALGTAAAAAGLAGRLREAGELATAALDAMRRIDQQWGVARALLGLGDLARVRGDTRDARDCYLRALPVLREVDARPETARCLAGLGRVAIDLGDLALAREQLSESLRISQRTGTRIGMARGLATFAALTLAEGRPDLALRLTAAASSLRSAAGLSGLPAAQAERYRAAVRHRGDQVVARLWAAGAALTSDEAVTLALAPVSGDDAGPAGPAPGGNGHGASTRGASAPGGLTPREREVASLIAGGHSNKAIAAELVISPATAARHVANIMAKLGFTSRAQIAAWAASQPPAREVSPRISAPGRRRGARRR